MQPLIAANTYGDRVDISDYVIDTQLGSISRRLDAYDTSIGIFRYSNLNIGCENKNGFFNDTGDFFTYKRDLAKVEVIFYDKGGTSFTNYEGVVNEAGTRTGINNNIINFLVTARETILSKVKATPTISPGESFSSVIKKILNRSEITAVMGYDANKINVDYDGTIDVTAPLTQIPTKDSLDMLLQASNSIFYVDSSGDMVVSSRSATSNIVTFYGAQDIFGRENIIQLYNYTGGYHRVYNRIIINDTERAVDSTSEAFYGTKPVEYVFEFITTAATETAIANAIISEFKDRKKECAIKVTSSEIRNINILDQVILDLVQTNYNNIDITTDQTWKIMGLTEYPSNYTADIHLREI
jgi:hypothetical protein